MPDKPVLEFDALRVTHVTVTPDGAEGALIGFELAAHADIALHLPPTVLAVLEAMLLAASVEQARTQPLQ